MGFRRSISQKKFKWFRASSNRAESRRGLPKLYLRHHIPFRDINLSSSTSSWASVKLILC